MRVPLPGIIFPTFNRKPGPAVMVVAAVPHPITVKAKSLDCKGCKPGLISTAVPLPALPVELRYTLKLP